MSAVTGAFASLFGRPPEGVWAVPGRLNLIGEHTDYNAGLVLPVAIDRRAKVAAARRRDGLVRCCSMQMEGDVLMALTDIAPGALTGWGAYPLGVLWAMAQAGHAVTGADILIDSDIPAGAGLASSAAVEVGVALAMARLVGTEIAHDDVARLCQAAEHAVARAPTGLMDQVAVQDCRAGHVLLLDCRTLDRELIPLPLVEETAELLVIDTGVVHDTSAAGYGRRREECVAAARALGIPSLREASMAAVAASLDGVLQRRARHVVTENERVALVAALLREGRVREIGPVLDEGHNSLRDDFEVSCAELDMAVETARDAGAWGARMTGAGFGGCAVALVPPGAVENVTDAIHEAFARHGHTRPVVFVATTADGARRVTI